MIDFNKSQVSGHEGADCSLNSPTAWGGVAVKLLQGVVYNDDNAEHWSLLLRHCSALTQYFGVIGVQLIVDENDGMAYLLQDETDDETSFQSESFPKLFRRTPLSYEQTLLLVLLRDELRAFEEQDLQNDRCVILQSELLSLWQNFVAPENDEVKLNRILTGHLRKLEELKFVRMHEASPASWEVRRIIKARLPLAELERLLSSLTAEAKRRNNDASEQ
ncbi:MAG: DUF4194 domain-containing protein [Planctomycetales bacterium]|nr:DUF4194 domain-containing protein [Planctomycetales bacterium]